MVMIGGIEVIEGDKLEILGRTYVLDMDYGLAGDFVVWADEKSFMRIYATPNFDTINGVPIQIDYDGYNIAVDTYEGNIDSYDHYKQIVKEIAGRLLANLPKCKCVGKDVGVCAPINIKDSDIYICTRCSGTIGKDEKGRKDILTKERVTEELNKILERYFEEKSQELGLKHGDISPDQTFKLDDAIEKIADIVIQWAVQNQ